MPINGGRTVPAFKERPTEIGQIRVEVPGGDDPSGVKTMVGVDLDDVLRQIVWDLMAERGWAENISKAAKHLGVPQRTLADFMDQSRERGLRVETLSRICAALKSTPVDILRRHEFYRPESADYAPAIDQPAYDSLRAVLTPQDAQRLYRIAQVLNDRQALKAQLDALESALAITQPPKKARKSAER
jgi:DNA-binding Xre family transcriptional regulator